MARLSTRLRKLRKYTDLTPRGLSLLAGLSPTHVSMIESGAREDPHCNTLVAIAEVTGASLDWLLRGMGNEPAKEDVLQAIHQAQVSRPAPVKVTSRRQPRVRRAEPQSAPETRAAS